MTEPEWLACDDPALLLELISDARPSDRKLRLFAYDCCRRLDALLSDGDRTVVAALERCAEGEIPPEKVLEAAGVSRSPFGYTWGGSGQRAVAEAISVHAWAAATRARAYVVDAVRTAEGRPARAAEWKRQSAIIRCVFGNPFRAVPLAPEWSTDTVLALAREAYASGDFSLVPILGDALEDAGCADPAVLRHCRSEGPHARGCWVVDLSLGKS